MFRNIWLCILAISSLVVQAQSSSSDVLHQLKKLQNTSRVLYLAAHPDDENTRMISWLVNGLGANTAYLSLTRGDGGQNLIGTELGAKLGVLRTQELMQAREIDGGQQFFSRAVDFGYSKTAEETLEFWDEDAVLSDVVWVIRKFRPDVIITRFPPDSRGGHGHHTASAMLALEAFDLAASDDAFPEQLKYIDTWQPKRIYWNASTWWNPNLDSIAKQDPDYLKVEVGGYDPIQGMSYNELASMSRTQHKSQGFGVSVARGNQSEYLKFLKGERAEESLFEGISTSWSRYGFDEADEKLAEIIDDYEPMQPTESIPDLLELLDDADEIDHEAERAYFREELTAVITKILGWHAVLLSGEEYLQSGEQVELQLEAINRTDYPVIPRALHVAGQRFELDDELVSNEIYTHDLQLKIDQKLSQPYWLEKPYDKLFTVSEQQLIGQPENQALLEAGLELMLGEQQLSVKVPAVYRFSNRVEGEIIRPVAITPALTVNPAQENMMFSSTEGQELILDIRFFKDVEQSIELEAEGYQLMPSSFSVSKPRQSDRLQKRIKITPQSTGTSTLKIRLANGEAVQSINEIDYPHIDKRLVFETADVKLIFPELSIRGERIGYIPGAGDKVAEAIRQMGYQVDILSENDIQNEDLSQYQAIVAGIRAYNTQEWLPASKERLMEYVHNGGNYVVQYNTSSRDLLSADIGPYPFKISRQRVTEESAEARLQLVDHPVLNSPNELSDADFEGWVQERGLYFASEWDEAYATPIGWNDEGEENQSGGLLIADHGKGAFIYTGISFFRELPAGVEGAYRLLANILSYENAADEQ